MATTKKPAVKTAKAVKETKEVKTVPRKSTKTNRKICKTLVYYRTRTRKNRKITSPRDSMGSGK